MYACGGSFSGTIACIAGLSRAWIYENWEGIAFSDFHAAFSVCTASRGALLTGRLSPRTGVGNNFGPDSDAGMALGERTIADWLAPSGYESHMIGKVGLRSRVSGLAGACMRSHF